VAETLMSSCPHDSPTGIGYCETCGTHVVRWRLTAGADRKYYDFVRSAGFADITFPAFCPERRFELRRGRLLIGRRSASRGIVPDIDLTGPPEDTSIGRSHALLVTQPTGSWAVLDLDSLNGTYLNYGTDPLPANEPVPVRIGDVIHLGGWTSLTLSASG
jgi:hypothetical protein